MIKLKKNNKNHKKNPMLKVKKKQVASSVRI